MSSRPATENDEGLIATTALGAGLAVGATAAASAAWGLSGFFTGIWPIDPRALLVAVSLLALAAGTAAFVPAWLAAHLDPASALRHE